MAAASEQSRQHEAAVSEAAGQLAIAAPPAIVVDIAEQTVCCGAPRQQAPQHCSSSAGREKAVMSHLLYLTPFDRREPTTTASAAIAV